MTRGYAGKYLDVDLGREKVKDTVFDDEILKTYIGGRGLATKILWDRLGKKWQDVDPLGPENIFTAFTGPLTAIHTGARFCASGKSPLSNGVIGSTASGEYASEVKCAGYDGVIVTGKASSPVYILVTDKAVEIRDASHIWGQCGEETIIALNKEVREELRNRSPGTGAVKEPGIIYIGPAGENRVRNAAVMQKIAHAAGYGGYGAVMGSKNLKAIVAKGRGPLPSVADKKRVLELLDLTHKSTISRGSMRRWGTGFGGYTTGASSSSEPVRNWQDEWHDEKQFGGPLFETRYWIKRYWSDFNCTVSCMKLSYIKTGPYKGDITDCPDYELEAYCGPNFGVYDPGETIHLSALIDNLGFSGINSANTMAFAAELYQRGIITQQDLGFKLEWGDADAFTKLAWLIAKREKIGDILAEGTYRAALKISKLKGIDVTPYAVHVKGVEIGAHGIRSGRDYPTTISYALSPQAGDHTSTVQDGYREMSGAVFSDSAVFCNFSVERSLQWEWLKAVTGWDITEQKWATENGPKVSQIQRALQLLGGPDIFWGTKDEDNPPRFYEPLPSGPYAGRTASRQEKRDLQTKYYQNVGCDENGIPTSQTLKKLGLEDVDTALEKLRK